MDISIDINSIIDSAQDGQWLLFAGLMLTALMQLARAVVPKMKKIPKRVLPWIIMTIGVLAAGGSVLAGGGSWQAAIIAGVTVGLGALGTYDLLKGPSEQAGLFMGERADRAEAAAEAAADADAEAKAEEGRKP